MGINTGQISQQTQRQCFTRINILTILIMLMLQFSLSMLIEQPGNILIRAISTFILFTFCTYVGLCLSNPSFRIQYIHPSTTNTNTNLGFNFNQGGQVKYVQTFKTNQVGIGESLTNFLALFVRNLRILLPVVMIATAITYCLQYCMQVLQAKQIKYAVQVINKIYSRLQTQGIDVSALGQEYIGLLAANYIDIIPLQTVRKMINITMQIGGLQILSYIFHFLFTWITLICLDSCIKAQANPDKTNSLTLSTMLRILWSKFIKLQVVTAQLRLSFRLIIVFIFYIALAPYYYISLAFMYRKIMDPQHKLQAIASALLVYKKQQLESQQNQQIINNNAYPNTNININTNVKLNVKSQQKNEQIQFQHQQDTNNNLQTNTDKYAQEITDVKTNIQNVVNIQMITVSIEKQGRRDRTFYQKKFNNKAAAYIARNKAQKKQEDNTQNLNHNRIQEMGQKTYNIYKNQNKRHRSRVKKQRQYRHIDEISSNEIYQQSRQRKIRKFIYRSYPVEEIIQV